MVSPTAEVWIKILVRKSGRDGKALCWQKPVRTLLWNSEVLWIPENFPEFSREEYGAFLLCRTEPMDRAISLSLVCCKIQPVIYGAAELHEWLVLAWSWETSKLLQSRYLCWLAAVGQMISSRAMSRESRASSVLQFYFIAALVGSPHQNLLYLLSEAMHVPPLCCWARQEHSLFWVSQPCSEVLDLSCPRAQAHPAIGTH